MAIKSIMTVPPPKFGPGPVDGLDLNVALNQLFRDVISKLDLRYVNNDFGGLGTTGNVLTSNGSTACPSWQAASSSSLPSIANNTVLGNTSGGTATATAIVESSLAAMLAGVPTGKISMTAVNGVASTLMQSDSHAAIDAAMAPTWTGTHTFNPGSADAFVLSSGDIKTNGTAGSAGQCLVTQGANVVPQWLSAVSGFGTANVQTFDQSGGASQTYTVPAKASFVRVYCIGGGGGGGSGRRDINTSSAGGGGGGAAGGVSVCDFTAAELGGAGTNITLTFSNASTGGAGGAAVTATVTTSGNTGTAGSNAQFGTLLIAYGGNPGAGGTTAGGTGGTNAAGIGTISQGTAGGIGNTNATGATGTNLATVSGATQNLNFLAPTGGGGGGGAAAAGTGTGAGGAGGGNAASNGFIPTANGGTGGTASPVGGGGGNGNSYSLQVATGGGGGGGVGDKSGTAGGKGGNGANYGGGGGGGGGTAGDTLAHTGTSGAGGNGGLAAVICIAW